MPQGTTGLSQRKTAAAGGVAALDPRPVLTRAARQCERQCLALRVGTRLATLVPGGDMRIEVPTVLTFVGRP